MYVNYVTTEEAIELLRKSKGKKVLVAIRDLENDEPALFCPKFKKDCEQMICEARTISSACDDFVKTLSLFTEQQMDLKNISPIGYEKTILLK